jgi:hypothetical protein
VLPGEGKEVMINTDLGDEAAENTNRLVHVKERVTTFIVFGRACQCLY